MRWEEASVESEVRKEGCDTREAVHLGVVWVECRSFAAPLHLIRRELEERVELA